MRAQKVLITTPYTRKATSSFEECYRWHTDILEKSGVAVTKQDAVRCSAVFERAGVHAKFGAEYSEQVDHTQLRNASWLNGFLNRRDADGGEKFVQHLQWLMADYIK